MEESVTLLTTATKDVNGNSRPTNDVSSESTSLKEEKVYQEYNLEGIGKDAISFKQILKTMPGETENGWEVIANLQNAVPFNDGQNGTDTMAVVMGTNNSNLAGNGIDGSQRRESRSSLATTVNMDVCRICHCESEPGAPLISPCVCSGSLKYVHQSCLQQWIKSANTKSCELCKCDFSMTTKIKPFRKWQKLEMSTVERRKIMCSVTFHVIAITCVIWSLYVLIDKTTQEIRQGLLEWPFWTKLIVVAIGFTGGLVFMYVQCKMYVQLCRRWKAYNRVIFIQNLPDGNAHKIPKQPVYTQAKVQSSQNHSSLYSDVDLL